ncbi:FAD-dependent monooxygenase, partial [Intrasporangium sp.]|uniref:FAD-dependent monooxygenase n=1 Tax=Intrasporangium sp. TaxID=1925024 RepID=UPI00293A94D3
MHVIVIGAGPIGLATAHGLLAAGAEVTVLESGPRSRPQGSGLSLFGNGVSALDSLGLGPALRRVTGDVAPTQGGIRSPRGDWLARTPDTALFNIRVVHREALHAALLEELPSGTVRFDSPAVLVSAAEGLVEVDGGEGASGAERLRADLVIVADGIRSRSRAQITADPGTRFAGYGAWRGVTRTVMPGVIPSETWGAGRRFGLVPLTDGRVYWFAVRDGAHAAPGDQRRQVLDLFGDWHDPIAAVVQATDADVVTWLPIEELARPLASFARGRAVLVGDAAHAMTPNLGQGANQGLEDAATLCALLRDSDDIPDALARYDAPRRARTRRVAQQSRLMGTVGQLASPLLVPVRDA